MGAGFYRNGSFRLTDTVNTSPPYIKKILESGLLTPGHVFTTDIFHDDYCALLRGTGPCDCDPDVGIEKAEP